MLKDKDRYLSILLITPSILAVLIFIYGFIGWSVRVSLSKWKGLNADYTWNGLKNYLDLFADPRFHVDVRNTLLFTATFVIGSLVLGFLLAVMLDQGVKGEGFFRSLFLFPMAISYIVTGVVWRWLMNPATGSRTSGLNLLFTDLNLDFLVMPGIPRQNGASRRSPWRRSGRCRGIRWRSIWRGCAPFPPS